MEKEHIEYIDTLYSIRTIYEDIKSRMSKSNGVFDLIYLEKMMQYIVPDGRLDLYTMQELINQINRISNDMAIFQCSTGEKRKQIFEEFGKQNKDKAKDLNDYRRFLIDKIYIEEQSIYNRSANPIYDDEKTVYSNEYLSSVLNDGIVRINDSCKKYTLNNKI